MMNFYGQPRPQQFNFNPQSQVRSRPFGGQMPGSQPRPHPIEGPGGIQPPPPAPMAQPRPHPMDGPIPQPAPPQPRQIDGPGGIRPTFGNLFAPQIQQAQQRNPGFMDNARQQWQQARQAQGPGFWRNYMTPGGGGQEMFPGFLNLFQNVMGGQPPQKFMNMAQRRGWAPQGQRRETPRDY
jgi:hypothetical protein